MNIVRELRKSAGLQQKELAAIVGVSIATVSDWETHKKNPSGKRLQKLAETFNVNPLVVLGVMSPTNGDSDAAPQTPQARILASGIDRMPERDRERALSMVRLMFDQYADYFEEREKADDT